MTLQTSINSQTLRDLELAIRERAESFHGKPVDELVVGIDYDGIMFDMHSEVLLHHNRRYASTDPVTYPDIVSWDSHGRMFYGETAVYEPKLYRDKYMLPVPGAVQGVKRLAKVVKKLVCVSHAPAPFIEPKLALLTKYFPDIKDFHWVADSKHDCGVDWQIDDGAHNLDGAPYRGILFDYPWNRHYTDAVPIQFPLPNISTWPRVFRVWGWNDVMALFGQTPVVTYKSLKAEYDKRYKAIVDYHAGFADRTAFQIDTINQLHWFIQHSRQLIAR